MFLLDAVIIPVQVWWIVGGVVGAGFLYFLYLLNEKGILDADRILQAIFERKKEIFTIRTLLPAKGNMPRYVDIPVPDSDVFETYKLDPLEGVSIKRDQTSNPIAVFKYRGPSGTFEFRECPWPEWEPIKSYGYLKGEAVHVRIIGKSGNALVVQNQMLKRELGRKDMIILTLEAKLNIKAQDSAIRKMREKQERKAIDSSSTPKAQGRNADEPLEPIPEGDADGNNE